MSPTLIRWQSHWHVVRQSWSFFQKRFRRAAIANRVMQTGPAIRESLVALLTAVWYILVYGTSALVLLASADRWLALADRALVCGLSGAAARFSCRACATVSKEMSEAPFAAHRPDRRQLHQYPHRQAVRASPGRRDRLCARGGRRAIPASSTRRCASTRCSGLTLTSLNALMVTSTAALALLLWTRGEGLGRHGGDGRCRWLGRSSNISGWVAWQVTAIFENIGVVQEGMMTIAQPIALTDRPQATSARGSTRR